MKVKHCTTVDDISLYIGRGCEIHPLLFDYFHDQLDLLLRKGKISLVPSAIFERFHRKLERVA